jgi:predicted transposase YbfD/YdcC
LDQYVRLGEAKQAQDLFGGWACSENAKGQALLSALRVGFAKAAELGGAEKAIIREIDGERESEIRIYVLSHLLKPAELLRVARSHWQIENGLHWELDVVVAENAARNRRDLGPANLAVLRRLALNVVRADDSKGSLSAKIKRAGWDDNFLLKLLSQKQP